MNNNRKENEEAVGGSILCIFIISKINNLWKVKISRGVKGKCHHYSKFSSIG
jgi:hypothetical protein